MDCTTGDFACYADLIRQKWLEWAPIFQSLTEALTNFYNAAIEALKPHLHSLIALGSLSFAIWKWVRYREGALFRRLKELVAKTISGLRLGRADLTAIVCRPAPGQSPTAPLFIEEALRSVLLRRYWWRVLSSRDPITSADRRLDRTLKEIDNQLQWTEMRLELYREQRATVHLVKGAIASARSDRANTAQGWWRTNNEALTHFRDALGVIGNDKDIDALEYKAHQLRKLGHLEGALAAYEELERCLGNIEDAKRKSTRLARARRYQAEIHRLQVPPSLRIANGLLSSALGALAPFAPLVDRDLLEQAEINELQGCVRFGLNFNNRARESLSDAQGDYQRLLDAFEEDKGHRMRRALRWLRSFFHNDGREEIRKAAEVGLARVTSALQTGVCKI
jgi:hypothetical protein